MDKCVNGSYAQVGSYGQGGQLVRLVVMFRVVSQVGSYVLRLGTDQQPMLLIRRSHLARKEPSPCNWVTELSRLAQFGHAFTQLGCGSPRIEMISGRGCVDTVI